jgi:hypothetical protein
MSEVKLCKDCAHCLPTIMSIPRGKPRPRPKWLWFNPAPLALTTKSIEVFDDRALCEVFFIGPEKHSAVTGELRWRPNALCKKAREDESSCGPSAKHFEPKS